jgi:thioredoxin-related protein
MKKMMKLGIVMLTVLVLFTGCKKKEEKKEPNINVNTNEEVVKEQDVDGITIKGVSLVIEDGISYYVAEAVNNTDADYKLEEYEIIVIGKDGNVIVTMPGYVGDVIPKKGSKTIKASINTDLSEAVEIRYEIKK